MIERILCIGLIAPIAFAAQDKDVCERAKVCATSFARSTVTNSISSFAGRPSTWPSIRST